MNTKQQIISKLKELTNYNYIEIMAKGNAAIWSALHVVKSDSQEVKKKVLIPQEGGWITYPTYPPKLELGVEEVKCLDAVLDLDDLKQKTVSADVLLYSNPGGYHAEQPMEEIYQICQQNDCLVILDVAGGIGTKLCDGRYADIIIGSFGRWKPINAHVGGFISTNNRELYDKIKPSFELLEGEDNFQTILEKMTNLDQRIEYLLGRRKQVIQDLEKLKLKDIVNKNHLGFVVVVEYSNEQEKEKIINYCDSSKLEYTQCPRYIRLNREAISIEIKKLE